MRPQLVIHLGGFLVREGARDVFRKEKAEGEDEGRVGRKLRRGCRGARAFVEAVGKFEFEADELVLSVARDRRRLPRGWIVPAFHEPAVLCSEQLKHNLTIREESIFTPKKNAFSFNCLFLFGFFSQSNKQANLFDT